MGAARHEHDNGNEEDDADLEEQRNPNSEGDERHGPGQERDAGAAQDGVNDLVGAAGLNEEGANNSHSFGHA